MSRHHSNDGRGLGAPSDYLNARPLVFGLELKPLFALRFDVPSKCAALLHEGSIDVGMIPSIEYCAATMLLHRARISGSSRPGRSPRWRCSTKRRCRSIRSIAADTSSRTSNALLRILCAEHFGIEPDFHADAAERG